MLRLNVKLVHPVLEFDRTAVLIAGEVLLDGRNIRHLQVEWLRSQVGLVSQEPALFNGSILENICYGREASLDEIEEAAKIAHAHTFITSLPNGYSSKVAKKNLHNVGSRIVTMTNLQKGL